MNRNQRATINLENKSWVRAFPSARASLKIPVNIYDAPFVIEPGVQDYPS